MKRLRLLLSLFLILTSPLAVSAAPAGKVVIAQSADASTLDATNHQETPTLNVVAQIYEALFERDQTLTRVPALAAEMPKFVSPTVLEVKLRRGVKFHNGEDFNAESVKFSLERLLNPANKLKGRSPLSPIDRVEIMDPYTVRIHTKKPWPLLVTALGFREGSMYPPKAYAGKDTAYISKNPIGTGPYRVVRWVKDDEVVLEANPNYWRSTPKIRTVVFKPIPDDAVRVAALQNGEVDVAVNIPPHLANVIANHPRISLWTAPGVRTIQLMFYTHQFDAEHKLAGPYEGPTADKRVRHAITYALDVDEIIKKILDGRGIRIATVLTEKHFGFDPALKPVRQDLARTKKLLAEAGYPNGLDITLNSPQGRYVRDKEVAEAVAGQLTKAAVRTTLRTVEFVTYMNRMVYTHKAGPMWLIGWGAPSLDAENVYVPLFRSGKVAANYYNPELDQMLDEAQTIMDPRKRLEQYHRINRLMVEDAPVMPLYQQVDLYGLSKRLQWTPRSDELIKVYEMALKDGKSQ